MKFFDAARSFRPYITEVMETIRDIFERGDFILGREVEELEKELSSYVGVKYTICVSSGTMGLLLSLMALGIGEGDEIITVPYTFYATVEMIALLKARPVFVDVDEKTFLIDPDKIEEKITEKTRAIIAVSLFGLTPDFDRLKEISKKYSLYIIEDAAQSFGAEYKGRKSCSIADISVTSFFPTKPLGGPGDGGAVFTNSENLYKRILMLRNHGQRKREEFDLIGINGRMDTIKAGILRIKLKYLDDELSRRRKIARIYDENLSNLLEIPFIPEGRVSSYAQYTVKLRERDKLKRYLEKMGIPTAIYYPKPLHLQTSLSYLGYKKGDFPVSEKLSRVSLSLPIDPFMDEREIDMVIEGIKNFFRR